MQPPESTLSRSGQSSANLRGRVPIIVNDGNATGAANQLKAAIHSVEVFQRLADILHGDVEPDPHGNRRRRIPHVVFSWNAKVELSQRISAVAGMKGAQYCGTVARSAMQIRNEEVGLVMRTISLDPPLHRG